MDECCVMKICSRCVLGLMVVLIGVMAGCLVPPPATDAAAVAAYNNQIVSLLTPFVTPIVTLLGVLALWLKSNWDKRELSRKTDEAAEKLAAASQERNAKVLEKVQEAREINVTALNAANSTNEKIAALHQTVAEQTKRAPARATDKAAVVVAVPPDHIQKVEITGGAGVETPLKVEDAKR